MDERTNKVTVSGIFNVLEVPHLATSYDQPIVLFFALSGVRGRVEMKLCLVDLSTLELVIDRPVMVESYDPLEITDIHNIGAGQRDALSAPRLDDGTFLAVAAQMPDVSARGTTEAESLAHVASALAMTIPQRRTDTGVPWGAPPDDVPVGAVVRWVFADTRTPG